jgi:hypothetical protein
VIIRRGSIIQQWQTDDEGRADLGRAVHFDRAVMIFDYFFGDVETEARPAFCLLGREIRIENFCHLLGRDPVSGIFNLNVDVKISLHATNGDGALRLRGCLHRIDQYILNGTRDLHGVAEKRARILANVAD